MTFEDARAASYARLDGYWPAAHPTIPVQYENRLLVDVAERAEPYVTCAAVFNDSEQMSLGEDGPTRYYGALWLTVYVKENQGVKDSLGYLEELAQLFKRKIFSGVHTETPIPVPGVPRDGWYVQAVRVPFYFEQF